MRNTFYLPVILLTLFFVASCKDKEKKVDTKDKDDKTTVTTKDDYKSDDETSVTDEKDNGSNSIVGKWHFVDVYAEGGEELTELDRQEMRSSNIEFTRDGHYIAKTKKSGVEDQTEYGTYQFDTKAKTLVTIADKTGKEEAFTFEFRGKDKIILTIRGEKITVTMERR